VDQVDQTAAAVEALQKQEAAVAAVTGRLLAAQQALAR
jgi:hypothetical protein